MESKINNLLVELEIFGKNNKGYFNIPKETGDLLNLLIKISKSKNIVEVGTSNGYSTLWLAEAATHNNGKVTTIEIDEDKIIQAENNINKSGLTHIIKVIHGDAIEILNQLNEPIDFLFLDGTKKDYINYLNVALPNLTENSIITADNVIIFKEKMKDFLTFINKNFETIILPLGTGLSISYKSK